MFPARGAKEPGDSSHAQALAGDLKKEFPEDTSVKFSYLPTVRGVLALNPGQPANAIELLKVAAENEFQGIVDRRGVVASDPISALAHLQLGRAYPMAGDKAKAKSAYEDFLKLWKDADTEIPTYKQAKIEYVSRQVSERPEYRS